MKSCLFLLCVAYGQAASEQGRHSQLTRREASGIVRDTLEAESGEVVHGKGSIVRQPHQHQASAASETTRDKQEKDLLLQVQAQPRGELVDGAVLLRNSSYSASSGSTSSEMRGFIVNVLCFLGAAGVLAVIAASTGRDAIRSICTAGCYILVSSSMIESNKWLMLPEHFPHPISLTMIHMFTSFFVLACVQKIVPSALPAMQTLDVTPRLCSKFIALGVCFSSSIICSNSAYKYVSLSFLQIIKESNIVSIYVLSVIFGLEALRRCSVILLCITFFGTVMAVHGEVHFQLIGLLLQVASSFSEACKVCMQSVLMSGGDRLDPLTTVLFMAFGCLCVSFGPFLLVDGPNIKEIGAQVVTLFPIIALNASLAVTLNITIAMTIKNLSAVGFILASVIKDVCIVCFSACIFGDQLSMQQLVGFGIACTGVAAYSTYKHYKRCFEEDHLSVGFARVVQCIRDEFQVAPPANSNESATKVDTRYTGGQQIAMAVGALMLTLVMLKH